MSIAWTLAVGLSCLTAAGAPRSLERPGDPYRPGPDLGTTAAMRVPAGAVTSVQVNVNAQGQNINGDAANEPSIAVDPTAPNRMAIGWRQFDTVASNFRQAGWSYSVDGGRTWAGLNRIEPGVFRSDPVLRAGADGTFYYLSLHTSPDFTCDMFVSANAGQAWPVKNPAQGGDKAWFAIDATGGPGHGNIYECWNTAGNEFFPAQFTRSTDGSATFGTPVEYDPVNQVAMPVFGILDVGPSGEVYVAGSENSSDTNVFWVVRSTNAPDGQVAPSFDQITSIDLGGNLIIGELPNPAGLLGQVNVAVDRSGGPHHGNVYVLCSVDPPGLDPMDVMFIRSTDGGASFSAPLRVNDDKATANHWQWFGTMSVAPGGRIDVVWNDTRNGGGAANMSQLFYSYSTNGGVSFSPNAALSPSWNSTIGFPNQNKIGDYYDLNSDDVGADLAWAATFTGGQDVYYLRIGDYDCNRNGVPDAEDLFGGTSNDCNGNSIPDECEIAAGTAPDANGDGVIDGCPVCPWDCGDINGVVDVVDFLALLQQWAQVGAACDVNGGGVSTTDFLALLAHWGPCPG